MPYLKFLTQTRNLGLAHITVWPRKVQKHPVLFKQLFNVGLTQIVLLGTKGIFGCFFIQSILALKSLLYCIGNFIGTFI